MTEETLERMGVMPSRLRRELLQEVLYLRLQQEMEELLDITDEGSLWCNRMVSPTACLALVKVGLALME
ncbi:hypothetical protein JRQ81_005454 [Phrynocephalus forsythii]|uniref:Uncharacterized protein n=1 Tax=Phrynocephalus forsythii TaxID=171643 RepID=A0A9Q0Y2W8_9SAUR|nr:hypothetical protein JRQ81_005454 [Phrynocephalus forsythii]